jgi:hypothetical protein
MAKTTKLTVEKVLENTEQRLFQVEEFAARGRNDRA